MGEGSITLAELAKSGRRVIVQCGACPNSLSELTDARTFSIPFLQLYLEGARSIRARYTMRV
jgi:hypothetical protein